MVGVSVSLTDQVRGGFSHVSRRQSDSEWVAGLVDRVLRLVKQAERETQAEGLAARLVGTEGHWEALTGTRLICVTD
jgi:hypothetical protein